MNQSTDANGTVKKESRFAELALELFGAKAAEDFIRQVWVEASPEVRQALADSVIEKMRAELNRTGSISWAMEEQVRLMAREAMAQAFEPIRAECAARAAKALEAAAPAAVEAAIAAATKGAALYIAKEFGEQFRSRLAKAFGGY